MQPLAHIDSFPPEILAEVLLAHANITERENLCKSNLNLCWVSRKWRQVAISEPRLWSIIYIDLATTNPWLPLRIFHLFLERSTITPLDITFFGAHRYISRNMDDILKYAKAVLDSLASHIRRWQSFAYHLDGMLMDVVKDIPFASAEQLKSIYVRVFGLARDSEAQVVSAIAGAPALCSIKWASSIMGKNIASNLPLERLIHLDITEYMTFMEAFQMMKRCKLAVRIGIGLISGVAGLGYARAEAHHYPFVSLVNLRILRLSISDSTGYTMLKYLDFPNLQILHLINSRGGPPLGHDLTPLTHYLSNSQHSLQALSVDNKSLRPEQLSAFFLHPQIVGIPIVQVFTRQLPDDIQVQLNQAVGETSLGLLPANFKVILGSYPDGNCTTMGWADSVTYARFEDYFSDPTITFNSNLLS